MLIEVIDHADKGFTSYYMIPKPIGEIIIDKFGKDIYVEPRKMEEYLFDKYMSFCTPLEDTVVVCPDITLHTC